MVILFSGVSLNFRAAERASERDHSIRFRRGHSAGIALLS